MEISKLIQNEEFLVFLEQYTLSIFKKEIKNSVIDNSNVNFTPTPTPNDGSYSDSSQSQQNNNIIIKDNGKKAQQLISFYQKNQKKNNQAEILFDLSQKENLLDPEDRSLQILDISPYKNKDFEQEDYQLINQQTQDEVNDGDSIKFLQQTLSTVVSTIQELSQTQFSINMIHFQQTIEEQFTILNTNTEQLREQIENIQLNLNSGNQYQTDEILNIENRNENSIKFGEKFVGKHQRNHSYANQGYDDISQNYLEETKDSVGEERLETGKMIAFEIENKTSHLSQLYSISQQSINDMRLQLNQIEQEWEDRYETLDVQIANLMDSIGMLQEEIDERTKTKQKKNFLGII